MVQAEPHTRRRSGSDSSSALLHARVSSGVRLKREAWLEDMGVNERVNEACAIGLDWKFGMEGPDFLVSLDLWGDTLRLARSRDPDVEGEDSHLSFPRDERDHSPSQMPTEATQITDLEGGCIMLKLDNKQVEVPSTEDPEIVEEDLRPREIVLRGLRMLKWWTLVIEQDKPYAQ